MIHMYDGLIQGTDAWAQARLGLLTASEVELIISPKTLEPADNDKARAHVNELAAQRITQFVEPSYYNDEMLRGTNDEVEARNLYSQKYAEIEEVGFITNDSIVPGELIGWSPDGLQQANRKRAIEIKSRKAKLQLATILGNEMPIEFRIQVQTAMMVGELESMDFVSYCAGMPMFTVTVLPDLVVQEKIKAAMVTFFEKLSTTLAKYRAMLGSPDFRLVPTERKNEEIV